MSTVYGVAPHPSLKQVPLTVSEDNGRYLDIKSSENDNKHGNIEETSLALSAEVDSRTSKDDMLNSVPSKETEKLSSCAPSSKAAVHFDKPNRLVISRKVHAIIKNSCKVSRYFSNSEILPNEYIICVLKANKGLNIPLGYSADIFILFLISLGRSTYDKPTVLVLRVSEVSILFISTCF